MSNKIFEKKMRSNGYTKEDIAKLLKISVNELDEKLNNKKDFNASEIYILAGLLRISLNDIPFE